MFHRLTKSLSFAVILAIATASIVFAQEQTGFWCSIHKRTYDCSGKTDCARKEYDHLCHEHNVCNSGGGARVNPAIQQASDINEAGRRALAAGDYDRAADLFRQASDTWDDPIYKKNERLALARKHFQLGSAAFDAENWNRAVAEYEQSLAYEDDDAARDNIRSARFNQSFDWYWDAYKAKRYKEARVYLTQANAILPVSDLADRMRDIRIAELEDAAQTAFDAKDYVRSESFFLQLAALNPKSAYAANGYANSITYQALALGDGASIDAVTAAFDRAIAAYTAGLWRVGQDPSLLQSAAWARASARRQLTQRARTQSDWNRIVATHERWKSAPSADASAAKELETVREGQATALNNENRVAGNNAIAIAEQARALPATTPVADAIASFDRAINAFAKGVRDFPSDASMAQNLKWARETARRDLARRAKTKADWDAIVAAHERWVLNSSGDPDAKRALSAVQSADQRAAEEAGKLAESQAVARSMTQQPGRRTKALEQLENSGGDGRCSFDGSGKGCARIAAGAVSVPTGAAFKFAPASEETPEQKRIHASITTEQADIEKLAAELPKTSDPVQRAMKKQELSHKEAAVAADKVAYEDARPHKIAPRKP